MSLLQETVFLGRLETSSLELWRSQRPCVSGAEGGLQPASARAAALSPWLQGNYFCPLPEETGHRPFPGQAETSSPCHTSTAALAEGPSQAVPGPTTSRNCTLIYVHAFGYTAIESHYTTEHRRLRTLLVHT